ncbi:MAG: glycosyltransferase family 39 protein, partial [Bryobacteraceae bacterium]
MVRAAPFALFFIAVGIVFIPYAGIQNDEALFANPMYSPRNALFWLSIFHHLVPVMQLSYVGALKTWIYRPIFAVWAPSAFSFRLPVLVAGAGAIWCFYWVLEATLGAGTAVAGALLLATDSMYLLTTCFDWGPVALQHLLLLAGLALVVRFHRLGGRWQPLAGAFFCFGLAMWDKALFSWILGGLVVAAAVIFPRELWRAATRRNLAVAVLAFLAGAAPFVAYNIQRPMATFRGNASFSTQAFANKVEVMRTTLNGSAMFGYLVYEEWIDQSKPPVTLMERASIRVRDFAGARRTNYLTAALAIAMLLAPLWWRNAPVRRAILFSVIFLIAAWTQMLFIRHAGTGSHHVVLLWPFPHLIVAAAFVA